MAFLTQHTDDGQQKHELGEVTVLGREAGCDIVLANPKVSRKHARIRRDGERWLFEDLGSHNGSRINGAPQTAMALADGDVIELDPYRLEFHLSPPARETGPEAAEAAPRDTHQLPGQLSAIASLDLSRVKAPAPPQDIVALSRRLRASYEIARATTATLSEPELLEEVLSALFDIFDTADRGMILLVDTANGSVRRGPCKQRTGGADDALTLSDTALDHALKSRKAVLCLDTQDDGRFSAAQSIVAVGIRSIMIAPLVYRDQLYGAIYMDALQRTAGFQNADLQLLSVAAADVAAALAHTELHRQVVKNERLAAMGEAAAGLSHCIKNILQGVKTGSYVVDRGLEKQNLELIASGWQVIKKKNDFMEKLVWDLLTLSKPREAAYESTDLNALCAEICDVGAQREEGPTAPVTFTPDPALPAVELDPHGMRRCLLNLVTNAMDACTATGGDVKVETHAPDGNGCVRVVVRDGGCGMSEETLAQLFTVFFSTKGARGTGLGLPVTRKIVEEHGGSIEVSSTQGAGTTFTVSLPTARPA